MAWYMRAFYALMATAASVIVAVHFASTCHCWYWTTQAALALGFWYMLGRGLSQRYSTIRSVTTSIRLLYVAMGAVGLNAISMGLMFATKYYDGTWRWTGSSLVHIINLVIASSLSVLVLYMRQRELRELLAWNELVNDIKEART